MSLSLLLRIPTGERLERFRQRLTGSYWFVPGLMTIGAAVLGFVVVRLDRHFAGTENPLLATLYQAGPEGARTMLGTIAGSMITVAGVSFSVMVVALSLAASMYGPRLLPNFMRDRGNQATLGTFLATFVYCMVVLKTVRGGEDSTFVPSLGVAVAVVLALVSVGVLIYFLHHAAQSMQVGTIIKASGANLDAAIRRSFPETDEEFEVAVDEPDSAGRPVAAGAAGYLEGIDEKALRDLATEHGLRIDLLVRVGDFLVAGQCVAAVHGGEDGDGEDDRDLTEEIGRRLLLSSQRTAHEDVLFSVNQLVEMAARALSPGINDPRTAVQCVDQLAASLAELSGRGPQQTVWMDEEGTVRLTVPPLTASEVVEEAFTLIRLYGGGSLVVPLELLDAIAALSECCHRADIHSELERQAGLVVASAREALTQPEDLERVERRYERAMQALGRGP